MKHLPYTILLTAALLLCGCNTALRSYYFPVGQLEEASVYRYANLTDAGNGQLWHLSSDGTRNRLQIRAYYADREPFEFSREKITGRGAKLTSLTGFVPREGQGSDTIRYELDEGLSYAWHPEREYGWSATFSDSGLQDARLQVSRRFERRDSLRVMGRMQPVAVVRGQYAIEMTDSDDAFTFEQLSYYAEGIGLVRMERTFADGTEEVLQLAEILPVPEWMKQ